MEERRSLPKPPRFTALDVGTAGLIVVWLAVACYAIAYLISH